MVKNNKLILLSFVIILLLSSCIKKEKQNKNETVKGREYITETGFKEEITERETVESTTQKFDITTHPELWLPTDKDTLQNLLNGLFCDLSKEYSFLSYKNRVNEAKLSESLIEKYNIGKFCLGLVTPLDPKEYENEWETVKSVHFTEDEFIKKQFKVFTSNWIVDREHTFSFELDENNCIDSIQLIKTELIHDYRNDIDYKEYEIASQEEIYFDSIRSLVQAKLDEFETWKIYGSFSQEFVSKFDVEKGLINGLDQYSVSKVDSNELTDIDNKCVGLTITLRDNTMLKYKIYFDVDAEDKIDSITKIEEVLEDGTVVELENNFGK